DSHRIISPQHTMSQFFSSLLLSTFLVISVYSYHQYRELKCTTPSGTVRGGGEEASCHLVLKNEELEDGRDLPVGTGCFKEDGPKGEEREYCDLVCPKSHTVFIAFIDQGHRACFNFYTYQIEKREDEWFLWRSGKCLNSTVNYRIGCKHDVPFDTQFKNDNEILDHLRRRV
ncbi:hypothetical protein PFISCL1PPCAC_6322, partial [Pristionchus fissidentatus]